MIFGHFLEHFHRQVYGGTFDPASQFADEDGFREDVIAALKAIKTPVIRWPGGCFVSDYHWEDGVGAHRVPRFNRAWRVEEDNSFGTDEFVKLCRKIACEPYICSNAGTGTAEEMANWMEYCNLEHEGVFAKQRIANGFASPHNVKYWSVGNENYGDWEIGAKDRHEWARLVTETAKLCKRVDPEAQLSAAALTDIDWTLELLKSAGKYLSWVSLHGYWDGFSPKDFEECMKRASNLDGDIQRVRGLLCALGLEKKLKIAFDEWNLRGWYHPDSHVAVPPKDAKAVAALRDGNDDNATYTMADAIFSACFLNACLRNADIVGMANFAPVVNTRGAIFTHEDGIVLRSTYYVFHMYTNLLGGTVVDSWSESSDEMIDLVATRDSVSGAITIAAANKHGSEERTLSLAGLERGNVTVTTLSGRSKDDFNDISQSFVVPFINKEAVSIGEMGEATIILPPHSVNIIAVQPRQ
jgi:alpha-N-arabinofuranosidase